MQHFYQIKIKLRQNIYAFTSRDPTSHASSNAANAPSKPKFTSATEEAAKKPTVETDAATYPAAISKNRPTSYATTAYKLLLLNAK